MTVTDERPALIAPADRSLPWGSEILRSVAGDPYVAPATVVTDKTARQALTKAGLNWTVQRVDATAPAQPKPVGKGEWPEVVIDNKWFARRSDNGAVLGFLGPDHELFQPREMAEFVDTLVDTEASSLVGMGITKDGERFGAKAYCVVKLDEPIMPHGMPEEATDVFFLLSNAWDSSQSLMASIVPYRRVCVNGLRYPIGKSVLTWRIRHSKTMAARVTEVQTSIQTVAKWAETFRIDAEKLLDMPIALGDVDELVEVLLPIIPPRIDGAKVVNQAAITRRENQRDAFAGAWMGSETLNDQVRYTRWGALNAWAEWSQWGRPDLKMEPLDRLLTQNVDLTVAKAHTALTHVPKAD
jgi:phage/plasmid-like protein (TIGR03299 family)